MSNSKFMQNQMRVTLKKVIGILNITEADYIEYLHNTGTDWLLDHMNNDTLLTDEIMQCEAFWKWWSYQAYHRDVQWLDSISYAMATHYEPNRLLHDWLYYHSADRLVNMANKHAQILYNSYANINWAKHASHN